MDAKTSREYDWVAEWCAKRQIAGVLGDPLPALVSSAVVDAINEDTEAFARRIRECAYALAREASAQE